MRRLPFTTFVLALSLFAGSAFADTAEIAFFRGIMSPLNESPAVNLRAGAPGTLICHIVRDSAGKINSASIDFLVGYGFPAPVQFTGLDIHSGAAGTNGPVVIHTPFGATSPAPSDPSGSGLISLEAEILPSDQTGLDALNGMLQNPDQYYIDLHTTDFPNGVVRAQLNRATFVVPLSLLSPSRMVPAILGSTASAAAQLIVLSAHDRAGNITSTQLIFDVNYSLGKQTAITGLHVHRGAEGVNGPVVIDSGIGQGFFPPVQTNASGSGNLRQFAEVDMTNPDQVAAVQGLINHPQDYYIDIHTTDFPDGLARDQVRGTDLMKAPITMTPPGQTASNTLPYAPTLLLLITLRAPDGTPQMGSIMWICNYRFPGQTVFTGLDIYEGAEGETGTRRLASGVSLTQPYPTDTGFGNMFFFTTVSDPDGVAALDGITRNPERYYAAILTGTDGAVAVRGQLGPAITALPTVSGAGNSANGKALAPGGMISIYGTNLSKTATDPYDGRTLQIPGTTGWFGKALPTNYNGTSVTIAGVPAPLLYVSPTQINAQVPLEVPEGRHPLVVSNSNGAGTAATVSIGVDYAPAIFVTPAGALVFKAADGSLVSSMNPASAGDSLLVYATGLGRTDPPLASGQLTPSNNLTYSYTTIGLVTARIGNVDAPVETATAAAGFAGLYIVKLTVPSGIPSGTDGLQLRMPASPLIVFGAPDYSVSDTVDIAIK